MLIYFWERERSMSERGAEREGHTESEAGSRLWAVCTEPDTGLGSRTQELWDHDPSQGQRLNQLSHPGTPQSVFIKNEMNVGANLEVGGIRAKRSVIGTTRKKPMEKQKSIWLYNLLGAKISALGIRLCTIGNEGFGWLFRHDPCVSTVLSSAFKEI